MVLQLAKLLLRNLESLQYLEVYLILESHITREFIYLKRSFDALFSNTDASNCSVHIVTDLMIIAPTLET